MGTVFTEGRHAGEFMISEANGNRSRESAVIASGEGVIAAGQVLGKVSADTGVVTVGAAVLVGTGNGVLTLANPAYGAGVKEGNYTLTCIEPAANAGVFSIEDPDGIEIGTATVAVAYDGVIKFTIADGATDFIAGDRFTVPVTIADLATKGKYRSADPTNVDGSAVAVAIAIYGCDATAADQEIAIMARDCTVNGKVLTYDAAVDDDAKKATKVAELAAVGIIVR